MVPASPFRLGFAAFADYLLFMLVGVPLWISLQDEPGTGKAAFFASTAIVLLLYMTVCLGRWGQTLGMRFTCVQILHASGRLLAYRRAFLMSLVFGGLFSVLPIFVFEMDSIRPTDLVYPETLFFFLYMFEIWKGAPALMTILPRWRGVEAPADEIVVVVKRPHEEGAEQDQA